MKDITITMQPSGYFAAEVHDRATKEAPSVADKNMANERMHPDDVVLALSELAASHGYGLVSAGHKEAD